VSGEGERRIEEAFEWARSLSPQRVVEPWEPRIDSLDDFAQQAAAGMPPAVAMAELAEAWKRHAPPHRGERP